MLYQKIKRLVLGGADRGKEKCFFVFRSRGRMDENEVFEEMSRHSGVCRADIVRILYLLSDVLRKELRNGRIVEISRVGSFRATASYGAVGKNESFSRNKVKGVKIIFTPHKSLRLRPGNLRFSPHRGGSILLK